MPELQNIKLSLSPKQSHAERNTELHQNHRWGTASRRTTQLQDRYWVDLQLFHLIEKHLQLNLPYSKLDKLDLDLPLRWGVVTVNNFKKAFDRVWLSDVKIRHWRGFCLSHLLPTLYRSANRHQQRTARPYQHTDIQLEWRQELMSKVLVIGDGKAEMYMNRVWLNEVNSFKDLKASISKDNSFTTDIGIRTVTAAIGGLFWTVSGVVMTSSLL